MEKVSTFQKRLTEILQERQISQAELARRTGIWASAISDYVKGKYEAKQDKLSTLAKELNVSETWLMGFDVSKKRQPIGNAKTAEVDPPKGTVIYQDSDYTLTSGTRRMKDGAADFLHGTLDTMTEPRDDDYSSSTSSIPSRDEIFDWLNTYWLMAADDGTNIERYTDEELLDYYYAAREAYEEEMEKDR